jgi:hypothetical protein
LLAALLYNMPFHGSESQMNPVIIVGKARKSVKQPVTGCA